jgi:hypothetical protein
LVNDLSKLLKEVIEFDLNIINFPLHK